MAKINTPFAQFVGLDGAPLENGYIYVGLANANPETSPITVYWDEALTTPAAQPLRTINGHIVRAGTAANIYSATTYSITVRDAERRLVYTRPSADAADFPSGATAVNAEDVVYEPAGSAVDSTVKAKLDIIVSVKDFGALGDGSTNDTAAFQAAIDAIPSSGGSVFIPRGIYVIASALLVKDNLRIYGEGDASQIRVNSDIEVFYSSRATDSTAIFRCEFKSFFIRKTVTGATSNFDIHLRNPNFCLFEGIRIQSGHDDNQYSNSNLGGIWLEKPSGSTTTAFCNRLHDCWMQNCCLYMQGITDSSVKGGYYWGHVSPYAIRVSGSSAGNIDFTGISGIITSQYNGGIWINGSGINQIRIVGCEWDGNPLLTLGTGIVSDNVTYQCVVSGNTFWGCGKHGIDVVDPVGWTITGNNFWKGNGQDNSYDDIRITGVSFQPNGNVVTGNTFTMDVSRTNKGYAIREVNGGAVPVANTYSGNGLTNAANYQSPAILILQYGAQVGNIGGGMESRLRLLSGNMDLDDTSINKSTIGLDVANSGTVDLSVNSGTYAGQPGAYAGTLTVASTRLNAPTQSRRTVYAVVGYGATATFTSLATQDGSGGGASFTVAMFGNGNIRITNTSGNNVQIRAHFTGAMGLA